LILQLHKSIYSCTTFCVELHARIIYYSNVVIAIAARMEYEVATATAEVIHMG